jgi:cell division protein YceG involved in septum cleavage
MIMIAVSRSYMRYRRNSTKIVFVLGLCLTIIAALLISLVINYLTAENSNPTSYKAITIQQGDTLWELAAESNYSSDISALVDKTMRYNNLRSTYIEPGQVIYIPVRS